MYAGKLRPLPATPEDSPNHLDDEDDYDDGGVVTISLPPKEMENKEAPFISKPAKENDCRKVHVPILYVLVAISFAMWITLFFLVLEKNSAILEALQKLNLNYSEEFMKKLAILEKLQNQNLNYSEKFVKDELMAKENSAASMLEDVMKLEKENNKLAKALTQGMEQFHGFSAALATNKSLSPVLETLAELKRENARIAEDMMEMLGVIRSFTEVFCTTCPAHWLHFQKSCYFFSMASKPWEAAQQACEDEGAHLVIVNHWTEQNFLAKQMVREQVFWIGLSDAGEEGQWTWVDGTPLSLSLWGNGEPNNAGSGEDCATLRFNGNWNDASCSGNEYWICEKKC
ncbi:uncharacterized protein PHA67_007683 isoform 2-T2 [Liasis olivaceus]